MATALIQRSADAVDTWETPDEVFEWASDMWGPFDLDAAADASNTKCERFISESECALRSRWEGRSVWLNPPYGRAMSRFVASACRRVEIGEVDTVVCLIAARTDTRIFQNIVFPRASHIHFIAGRLAFGCSQNPATFPSCFVVFQRCSFGPPAISYGPVGREQQQWIL
jgi:site-specific DNA-methyltransferase (adenine-specific)